MSMTISFQHINLDYLDTMSGGDTDTMQQMLEMLIEEIPTEITKMQDAVVSEDWEEVFQISHKLKTTLAFIGNDKMTTINQKIEHGTRPLANPKDVDKEALMEVLKDIPSKVRQLTDLSNPVMKELNTVKF